MARVSVTFTATPRPPPVRPVAVTFTATPRPPSPPRSVSVLFTARPRLPRTVSVLFRATPGDAPPSPRSVSVTFTATPRTIPGPRRVSVVFTGTFEDAETIPPELIDSPGSDIILLGNQNNIYRIDPASPTRTDGGYGVSLGRPSTIDRNDQVGAIASIGNIVFWFADESRRTTVHWMDILNPGVEGFYPSFFTGGRVLGADSINPTQVIMAIDAGTTSRSIRRWTIGNSNSQNLGSTPLEPGTTSPPILLGSLSYDPTSGDYFGTRHFDDDLWRINPADIDSTAGVYGRVGPLDGIDFPASFDIDPDTGVGYVFGTNQRILHSVNLTNGNVLSIGEVPEEARPLGMTFVPGLMYKLGLPTFTLSELTDTSVRVDIDEVQQATAYHVTVIDFGSLRLLSTM